MNTKFKKVLLALGILFALYTLTAQTGILKIYTNSTVANEPNLKLNSKFIVSNLVSPKNGDFISYHFEDPILGKHSRVHKLCGMSNDIIEIKNGVVYLNGENFDAASQQMHYYQITIREYETIKQKENIPDENFVQMIDSYTVNTTLEDTVAQKHGLTSKRVIERKGTTNEPIASIFKQPWNKDNFGPLKIPQGKIFVLGDNRDFSEDSRYVGLINATDILGVVILK